MRVIFPLTLLLVLSTSLACQRGPKLVPVTGKITYKDGMTLNSGVIEFAPEDGGPVSRSIIEPDGSFSLQTGNRAGAAPGKYKVVILQTLLIDGVPSAALHKHKGRRLHDRYRRYDSSGLKFVVEADKPNEFLIQVEPARN